MLKCDECDEEVRERNSRKIDKLIFHPKCRNKVFKDQNKVKYPRLFDATSRKPRNKYTSPNKG